MASLLLEIGTEELPAAFCPAALAQLGQLITASLQNWHFDALPSQGFATPRRLGVLVRDLPPRQKDLVKEHKGPSVGQAFHQGKATAAAQGFAQRWGLTVEELTIRTTPKGEFVFAEVTQPGQATEALLREAIPGWITAIQGKRLMRWGTGTQRFSRPIRWLVALLDDELLPVQLEQTSPVVSAQANSYGPRRGWRCDPLPIATAEAYEASLRKAGIVPDRQQRQADIRRLVESKAAEAGGRPSAQAGAVGGTDGSCGSAGVDRWSHRGTFSVPAGRGERHGDGDAPALCAFVSSAGGSLGAGCPWGAGSALSGHHQRQFPCGCNPHHPRE